MSPHPFHLTVNNVVYAATALSIMCEVGEKIRGPEKNWLNNWCQPACGVLSFIGFVSIIAKGTNTTSKMAVIYSGIITCAYAERQERSSGNKTLQERVKNGLVGVSVGMMFYTMLGVGLVGAEALHGFIKKNI